jgi:hypothetical protein
VHEKWRTGLTFFQHFYSQLMDRCADSLRLVWSHSILIDFFTFTLSNNQKKARFGLQLKKSSHGIFGGRLKRHLRDFLFATGDLDSFLAKTWHSGGFCSLFANTTPHYFAYHIINI